MIGRATGRSGRRDLPRQQPYQAPVYISYGTLLSLAKASLTQVLHGAWREELGWVLPLPGHVSSGGAFACVARQTNGSTGETGETGELSAVD